MIDCEEQASALCPHCDRLEHLLLTASPRFRDLCFAILPLVGWIRWQGTGAVGV